MGLLLTHAARRIREEKTSFSADALRHHYLEPLQQTHYWQDVEFLRGWPGYVKRDDGVLRPQPRPGPGQAYVWTRPGGWLSSARA